MVPIRKLFLLIVLTGILLVKAQNEPDFPSERLWYQQPAADWFSGLPIGNGRLGAMVYGTASEAHIQLNEESLWAGAPENPYPPNVEEHYAMFQQLSLEGSHEEALKYALEHLAVSPTSIRSYETLGDLFISFDHSKEPEVYERSLNLEKGIVQVTYEIDGNQYLQESFISTDYDVIVFHFSSLDSVPVNANITYERPEDIQLALDNNLIHVIGQVFDDPDAKDDNPGGSGETGYHMKFDAHIGVNTEAPIYSENQSLIISHTTEFTVIVSAATDYNPVLMNFDRSIDPSSISLTQLKAALGLPYEQVRFVHQSTHETSFHRVLLNLGNTVVDSIPTDKRIQHVRDGKEDPYLSQLLFQYGRYLLMSSSSFRAKLPANLQGIWNKDMWAAWESDYHLNINLQMNYWPANVTNLPETLDPLTDYLVRLAEKGKETAKRYIDSEGWMAHHATNIFGRTVPNGSTPGSQVNNGYCFPLAGAWMSLTLWRHFEFTLDTTYLREQAYPVLAGAAQFILDFLKENDRGQLVTVPSYSPENAYINPDNGKEIRNTVAATMDLQIIQELYKAIEQSEQILDIKDGLTESFSRAVDKMPKTHRIGSNGTIMEWIEDYEEQDPGHRHISHLFGLYPGNQITPDQPELFQAARATIDRRLSSGGGQTGWSRAWVVNFFARLYDAEACRKHINALITEQMTPSLLDLHPPNIFQIDGNLGVTAGIAEMLVQSHRGTIELLPALPKAWHTGSVKGLIARGAFELEIEWERHILTRVKIRSQKGSKGSVTYQGKILPVEIGAENTLTYEYDDFMSNR